MKTVCVYLRTVCWVVVCYVTAVSGGVDEDAGACERDGLCPDGAAAADKHAWTPPPAANTVTNLRLVKLDGIKVGHVESITLSNGQTLQQHTASMKPLVLELPNFLSKAECEHFMAVADKQGLVNSQTVRDDHMRSRSIKLLDVDQDQRLSINEMLLTIEDAFDVYLDEADLAILYKEMKLDANKDTYITPDEMQHINPQAFSKHLNDFVAHNPVKRSRLSQQVWLFPDSSKDSVFEAVQKRVHEVTQLPLVMIKRSDFQVVKYGPEGHYNAHQDSNSKSDEPCCTRKRTDKCRICRLMTVLFYLNNVEEGGGTAFPVSGNATYDEAKLREAHMINLYRHCHDSRLVVTPEPGKAIIWYNHHIDPDTGWVGEMDPFTWHGGCPVIRGEKWIANFWIKYSDDRDKYLRDGV